MGFLALVSVSAPGVPARAAETTCADQHEIYVSPGLTASPSSGQVTSKGETPTITCDGPINGAKPTGPGTVGFEGRYGSKDPDTCQSGGEGDGLLSLTIPTDSGPQHLEDRVEYTYGTFKAGSPFSGKWQGQRTSGTFEVQPLDGDCASNPVTKVRVTGRMSIRA